MLYTSQKTKLINACLTIEATLANFDRIYKPEEVKQAAIIERNVNSIKKAIKRLTIA